MIVECPGCKRRYDVSGRPPGTRARCRCNTTFTLPDPPRSGAALKCPNCGGNADSTATRCGYCDAHLAVRACPRCFGKLFLGTKFCPGCGARSDEPATALPDGSAAPRHCPRCKGGAQVRLESRLVSDLMLDTCPDCEGIFLDSDLLERILAERRFREDAAVAPAAAAPAAGTTDAPFYVRCPDCEGSMARRLFARRSGVIVDVCRHHGTWLDANELEQLVAFVQGGGLDHGRAATSFEATALRVPEPKPAPEPRRAAARSRGEPGFLEEAIGALRDLLQ